MARASYGDRVYADLVVLKKKDGKLVGEPGDEGVWAVSAEGAHARRSDQNRQTSRDRRQDGARTGADGRGHIQAALAEAARKGRAPS